MSHTVTVTRTTTTTTSAIIINTGYLKTWSGLLKLFELLLGIVNVGLVGYYFYTFVHYRIVLFFLLIAVTFMIGTFLLLLSCLITLSTASIISKTIYEIVYHAFAGLLYLAAGIALAIEMDKYKNQSHYEALFAAGIIGIVCSILYFLSTFFARRTYIGM